ncbi:SMP-30/gluconolactonase/LRE family protein [Aetokthonos hydrillicola]|uniref:SMP-30/gluconolactonase/LRE family protein n=1 Tax=Aetokthonos hydrillicola TaxID=1550245 RepID=UPI001ABB5011
MPEVIQIYDDRLRAIVSPSASLEKLATGAVHSEGPVYIREDDSVVWSDAHGNRLLRWSPTDNVTVLRDRSDYQSGNYRDLEGRIVACSSGLRAIIRREDDGEWKVLVDSYDGKRLNSPNDLVVKSDGTIWFTDPPYGITEPNQGYDGEQEQPGCYVYRFDPVTGEIYPVVTDMVRPNGLAFSPDESLLYVSDTAAFNIPGGPHHIRAYEVVDGRQVKNSREFAVIEPGQPDGFRVDEHGNVFTSSKDSVQVFAPDGTLLGKILVPETSTNLTFGGKERDSLSGTLRERLFITAGHSLYAINLNTRGVQL